MLRPPQFQLFPLSRITDALNEFKNNYNNHAISRSNYPTPEPWMKIIKPNITFL